MLRSLKVFPLLRSVTYGFACLIWMPLPVRSAILYDNTNELNPVFNSRYGISSNATSDGAGGFVDRPNSKGFQFALGGGGGGYNITQVDVYLSHFNGTTPIDFNIYRAPGLSGPQGPSLANFSVNFNISSNQRFTYAPTAALYLPVGQYLLVGSTTSIPDTGGSQYGWATGFADPNAFLWTLAGDVSFRSRGQGPLARIQGDEVPVTIPEPTQVLAPVVLGAAIILFKRRFQKAN